MWSLCTVFVSGMSEVWVHYNTWRLHSVFIFVSTGSRGMLTHFMPSYAYCCCVSVHMFVQQLIVILCYSLLAQNGQSHCNN